VSGLGEESIGNDLLGFSHAVLASGAAAFLGGLWSVSDEASALLMLFLAEEIKTNNGSKSLARCWRNAQIRLYKLNVEGEVAVLEDVKNCLKTHRGKVIDQKLAARLIRTMGIVIEDLQDLGTDFTHPYYLGAVCANGTFWNRAGFRRIC
jgi:CHAT domain-containing protein